MPSPFTLDGSLARSARHLTQVSVAVVARQAELDEEALRAYEYGVDSLDGAEVDRLTHALTSFGAVFIAEDEVGGVGVRRKFRQTSVERIEAWEGEGGIVADDDI